MKQCQARRAVGVEISESRLLEAQRSLRRFERVAPEAARKAHREVLTPICFDS